MTKLIITVSIFLIIGNILGQIILLQSIPKFALVKRYPLTIIKLYYGFHIYFLFGKRKDIRFILKYMFLANKFVLFVSCFCYCLEEYIKAHPQKEAVCKRNIKYIDTRSMRMNVYRNAEQNLLYA